MHKKKAHQAKEKEMHHEHHEKHHEAHKDGKKMADKAKTAHHKGK